MTLMHTINTLKSCFKKTCSIQVILVIATSTLLKAMYTDDSLISQTTNPILCNYAVCEAQLKALPRSMHPVILNHVINSYMSDKTNGLLLVLVVHALSRIGKSYTLHFSTTHRGLVYKQLHPESIDQENTHINNILLSYKSAITPLFTLSNDLNFLAQQYADVLTEEYALSIFDSLSVHDLTMIYERALLEQLQQYTIDDLCALVNSATISQVQYTHIASKVFVNKLTKLLAEYNKIQDIAWIRNWSPDNTHVALNSEDNTINVWDRETKRLVQVLHGHQDEITCISWSHDGKYIASGSQDATIRIWESKTGKCSYILQGHTDIVHAVHWSPYSRYVISGSQDKTIRIWDIQEQRCVHELQGHQGWVLSVSWSPDGNYFASCATDGTLRIWDSITKACIAVFTQEQRCTIWSIDWSPDSRYIAVSYDDGNVRIWSIQARQCVREFKEHTESIHSVKWLPNNKYIVSSTKHRAVKIWPWHEPYSFYYSKLLRPFALLFSNIHNKNR